jgi:outer membrane protein assembly factor BamB
LGGLSVSSPVAWEDRVFVTSQIGRGTLRTGSHPTLARGGQEVDEKPLGGSAAENRDGKVEFLVEAFHRRDGRLLWQYRTEAEGEFPPVHSKHNMASPSPITDGEHVFAWFATGQLVALNMAGKVVWKRHLGVEYGPFTINWGHGSSPALYQDLLILQCYHVPAAYLLALDKRTGKQRWRVDQETDRTSFCTPFVAHRSEGDELIVNSSRQVEGYDPHSGNLLWYAGEEVRYAIPVPAYADGILYMSRGYRNGPYMALRVGGRGDVTKSHMVWHVPRGAPYISSPVYLDGLVYMANGLGIVKCIDAATGDRVWQERIGGIYSASPVVAENRIYLLNESGETVVLRAGRTPHILQRNQLEERTVASPAISNRQIFIRSDQHLICIGQPSGSRSVKTSRGRTSSAAHSGGKAGQ